MGTTQSSLSEKVRSAGNQQVRSYIQETGQKRLDLSTAISPNSDLMILATNRHLGKPDCRRAMPSWCSDLKLIVNEEGDSPKRAAA